MITKARAFAITAHKDQQYGKDPYSVHLDAVAAIAKPYGETAQVIAYLHDVVEDTPVSIDDIEREFNLLVAKSVAILSDEPGPNRQTRKRKTYEKMASITGELEIALLVKAADRLANMQACVSNNNKRLTDIYQSEYPVFRQSAYRENSCDEIWAKLDTLANI